LESTKKRLMNSVSRSAAGSSAKDLRSESCRRSTRNRLRPKMAAAPMQANSGEVNL
jgi:hypothetical protein